MTANIYWYLVQRYVSRKQVNITSFTGSRSSAVVVVVVVLVVRLVLLIADRNTREWCDCRDGSGERLAVEDSRASVETVLYRTVSHVSVDWHAMGLACRCTASVIVIIISSISSSSMEQSTATEGDRSMPNTICRPRLCGLYFLVFNSVNDLVIIVSANFANLTHTARLMILRVF